MRILQGLSILVLAHGSISSAKAADGKKASAQESVAAAPVVCPLFEARDFDCGIQGGGAMYALGLFRDGGLTKSGGTYYFRGSKPTFKDPLPISKGRYLAREVWDFEFDKGCPQGETYQGLPLKVDNTFPMVEFSLECKDAETVVYSTYQGQQKYETEIKVTGEGIFVRGRALSWIKYLKVNPEKTAIECKWSAGLGMDSDHFCPRVGAKKPEGP